MSADLLVFGVKDSKLCQEILRPKKKKKATVLPPCIPIVYSQQGQGG